MPSLARKAGHSLGVSVRAMKDGRSVFEALTQSSSFAKARFLAFGFQNISHMCRCGENLVKALIS